MIVNFLLSPITTCDHVIECANTKTLAVCRGSFKGVSGVPRNPLHIKFFINCPQNFSKSMDGKNLLLPSKIVVKLEDHWLW